MTEWKYFTWLRRSTSDENKPIIWGRIVSLFASGRSWESARHAPTFTGGDLFTEHRQHAFIPLAINKYIIQIRHAYTSMPIVLIAA